MEALSVASEDEPSLANRIFHERCSECRSTRGDLGDFVHNDESVILFKM